MKFTPPQLGRRAEMGEQMHCRLMGPKSETSCDRKWKRTVIGGLDGELQPIPHAMAFAFAPEQPDQQSMPASD